MVKTRLTLPLTVAQVLATTPSIAGPPVTVSGWIRSTRAHRSTAFVQLTDGSSHRELQIVLQPEHRSSLPRLSVGTSIRVSGALVVPPSSTTTGTSSKESVELLSSSLEILGDCLPSEYPLAKTRLPLDYLRSLPHLRSRSRTFQSLWRVRSAAISGIHAFFAVRVFLFQFGFSRLMNFPCNLKETLVHTNSTTDFNVK